MAGVSKTSVFLAVLCSIVSGVWCLPTGAPSRACVSMLPVHLNPQTQLPTIGQPATSSPYSITANSTDYIMGQTIRVTVIAQVEFRGILLQARLVGTTTPVGTFSNIPNGAKTVTCSNSDDSVTHSSIESKASGFSVHWTASDNAIGDIEFSATIANTKEIFWPRLNSSVIRAVFDVCDPNPCYNGGNCYKAVDQRTYFCGCPTDLQTPGPNCEAGQPGNQCFPNPCLNGGECYRSAESTTQYHCQCIGLFDGNHCENAIVPCSPNPCLNGGFCVPTIGSFSCLCPVDRYGQRCENEIISCSENSCLNGATCLDTPTGHNCFCDSGWTGSNCNISSNPDPCRAFPCVNGGTCSQIGDTVQFTCSCIDRFEGDRCQTTTNPCQTSPCQNGGICFRDEEGSTFCQCPLIYTGTFCEMRVHPCDLPTSPCLNEGACFRNDSYQYFCLCADGYSGENCETLVDPCASDPCQNGGACEHGSVDEPYVCTCPAEYFGENCQNQGACYDVTCQNGGVCVPHADQTGYTCQCQQAYDGQNCEFANMCQLDNPCPEGSTCNNLGQGHIMCNCPPGIQGQFCEDDVSCNGHGCRNGATCMPVGDGNYKCKCLPAYSGDMCEIYTDLCVPDPCVNGVCRIVLISLTGRNCSCNAGYQGENCTIYIGNACEVFQCLNGGECVNSQPEPTCVCSQDYSGVHCDTPKNPTFTGCPSGVNPSFPLNEGSNMAYIDLTITARDRLNRPLQLTITDGLQFPDTVMFTEEYRDGKDITIEAEDDEGRSIMCEFKLRIFDAENPTVTCPADVSAITTEDSVAVNFPMGTATDNLGIGKELQYTPNNGSMFMAGTNTVIVKAEDTFANIGVCSFKVTLYKKADDCAAFTAPDNGVSDCAVVGERRMCTIGCNEGFGNAVGTDSYMCMYKEPAYWDPRPNADICVPFKPGSGVSKVVSIRFSIDSDLCNNADFDNLVISSLTGSLQTVGVCDPNASVMSCDFSVACDGGNRRRRAPTNLNVDVNIMSVTADGDTNMGVLTRLDDAVNRVMMASANGSLSVVVDGVMTTNEPAVFDVSDSTWNCKPGQITSSSGCLSCPPGTFHNSEKNTCEYCPVNTYQNKPEQDSCTSCPKDTGLEQTGAYSAEHCGPTTKQNTGPWTPTFIGLVAGAGAFILLLVVVLICVCYVKASRRPSDRSSSKSKDDLDGPLSNFTHLNKAYDESEEPEMQFHGGQALGSDTTYQNVVDDDGLDTVSTDYLVRIPSLSQYSDYYATLNARSAPIVSDSPPPPPPISAPAPPQANGGPPSPPPAPPAPNINMNNSNTLVAHIYQNGNATSNVGKAKFHV